MNDIEQVILDAIARYDRERDRYLKLATRVADVCRTIVVEDNAIRAQVTSRTKTLRSFEGKLRRFSRRADKQFSSVDEVFRRISDFAGVRIATYRPEDEARVAELITRIFCGEGDGPVDIDRKNRLDPANAQFYRSTHCQVFLKREDLVGDYSNLRGASCEIQICSMMAHVWNEIEHDIGYKPEGTGPDESEKGLLEILGHLTRSGDVAITRLLAANTLRLMNQTGDFADIHDFVARFRSRLPEADLDVNAGPAFQAATLLGLKSVEAIDVATNGEVFEAELQSRRLKDFNEFLEANGQGYLSLNSGSADLILIALLTTKFEAISSLLVDANQQIRRERLYSIIVAYRDFTSKMKDDYKNS